jgi:hypothetical protein
MKETLRSDTQRQATPHSVQYQIERTNGPKDTLLRILIRERKAYKQNLEVFRVYSKHTPSLLCPSATPFPFFFRPEMASLEILWKRNPRRIEGECAHDPRRYCFKGQTFGFWNSHPRFQYVCSQTKGTDCGVHILLERGA